MGDGMPYHVEKGPTWQIFDDYFSDDERIRHKLFVLESLWTQRRFTAYQDKFSPAPRTEPPGLSHFQGLVQHANVDWFGLPLLDATKPHSSDSYGDWAGCGGTPPQATGMWKTWCGNAEKIVRLTMIRSIEVSLGLDHPREKYNRATEPPLLTPVPPPDALSFLYASHKDPSGAPYVPNLADAKNLAPGQLVTRFARNWPIEHWWICGVRYFQASITWRRGPKPAASVVAAGVAAAAGAAADLPGDAPTRAEDTGRVVVVFVTPGSMHHHVFADLEHAPLNVPLPPGSPPAPAPSADPKGAPWLLDPVQSNSRFGSWIVGHRFHDLVDVPSHEPTHVGECPCPIKFSVQSGDVMTVQPAYDDGGVRAEATTY